MDTPHWYRRVLPVTALAVGLVALLALAVPGVRDQIELSASHQQQEYVALSFARAADGTVPVCTRDRGEVSVTFTVTSGLRETRTLDYVLTVGATRLTGAVSVDPGESVHTTHVVDRPAKRFDVVVRLPGADREVLAHCGGPGPRETAP